MQIKVTKISVTDSGDNFGGKLLNVTLNLKCWNDGDDLKIAIPIIDKNFSQNYSEVNGTTITQRATITGNLIKNDMQKCIDTYKKEVALLNNSILDAVISGIQSALVG